MLSLLKSKLALSFNLWPLLFFLICFALLCFFSAGCSPNKEKTHKNESLGKSVNQRSDKIIIRALTSDKINRLTQKPGWTPFDLIISPFKGQSQPKKFEIETRTEFYAFFVDKKNQLKEGDKVVFTWFYQDKETIFAKPCVQTLVKWPGLDHPTAFNYIWSSPSKANAFQSLFGLRSVMNYENWNKSRCFGPRVVTVNRFLGYQKSSGSKKIPIKGNLLGKAKFAIFEPQVEVYR